jgi:ABC-type Zn uptake system ZnuABC Zn-binding protein ZnuA
MKSKIFALITLLTFSTPAFAKLKVIASITPLQSITQSIGGDLVEVTSIARGTEDPHFVEVRPSFLMSIGQAKLYVSIGMSLDFWARPLIENARNENIVVINASTGIKVLGLPTERVSARLGDVHPEGNPHYWMDPYNIPVVVKNILNGLVKVDPANTETYQKNAKAFLAKLQAADAQWQKELAPYKGTKIVTYHESWEYFAEHFKLDAVAQVEPKPGIPPSGSHTDEVIQIVKRDKVPLILQEPYYPSAAPDLIARSTGAKVVKTPQLCGGAPGTDNYIDLVNHDVQAIAAALKK